jgi:hypothetical protein
MNFNLGNFGGQLNMDEVNGALGSAGADFQFGAGPEQAAGGIQAPTAPTPGAAIGQVEQDEKKKNAFGGALGMVGNLIGGVWGQALSAVGGMSK